MSNPTRIPVVLPSPSHGKNPNVGGEVFGKDPPPVPGDFPSPQQGKGGPFSLPASPIKTFDDAVNYYVNFVGDSLERLNALQFDLTTTNQQKKAQDLSDALADLADALNVGNLGNAKELRWPLAGSYRLTQDPTKIPAKIGFTSLVVDLYFENETRLRMVVNCTVLVTGTVSGTGQKVAPSGIFTTLAQSSSSSSYLATGSK